MNHHKRIVLDFDDTISFTKNRDWENAIPNLDLINKTNRLYDNGWEIDVYTARGSLSCSSREEASDKYREGIEKWLDRHGMKYHSLSFQKPLAAYYVDDKSITPEDFIKTDIRQLEGGLSGSDIYTDGLLVHKSDERAHIVKNWFDTARSFLNVPEVDRVVGNVISMHYIKHDISFFKNNQYVAIGLIQDALERMKHATPIEKFEFNDYINRIATHLENHIIDHYSTHIMKRLEDIKVEQTFSHGDFGITNMLFTDERKLFLIDPIPNMFGSIQLDAAKFIASLYINKYDFDSIQKITKIMRSFCEIGKYQFSTLILSELVRVVKYHPNKEFMLDLLKHVYTLRDF
jgi:capsule biosynthesis phosphatase